LLLPAAEAEVVQIMLVVVQAAVAPVVFVQLQGLL
jgi:hypothetical protein